MMQESPSPRRGLRREEAANYVAVSPEKFDELVAAGELPQPIRIDSCVVWDKRSIDAYTIDWGDPTHNPLDETPWPSPEPTPAPWTAAQAEEAGRFPVSRVYFIKGARLVKIGFAECPFLRMAELQQGSPTKLSILGLMRGQRKTEQELHKLFARYREHGEWFRYCATIRRFILEHCEVRTDA